LEFPEMRERSLWVSGLVVVLALTAAVVLWLGPKRRGSAASAAVAEASGPADPARPAARSPKDPERRDWFEARRSAEAAPAGGAVVPVAAERDAGAEAALERDRQLEVLRGSGPAPSGFLRAAEKVSRPWEELARATSGEIDVKSWECYRAGCFVNAVHRSARSVDDMTTRILGSSELGSWPGPKSRSAPIPLPDGRIELTWLLFAPEPDGGT
jgi:hypothetical protein